MTDKELMQQALCALEQVAEYFNADSTEAKTIIALRKRLVQPDPSAYWHNEFLKHNTTSEQPAQQHEPVAWMDGYRNIYSLEEKAAGCEDAVIPLVPATLQHWSDCAVHNEPAYQAGKCDCGGYTSPQPSKPWVSLTDDDLENAMEGCIDKWDIAEAIEAKLREKNA